jgi:predicted dienelactone hydrolase
MCTMQLGRPPHRLRLLAAGLAVSLLVAACGGDDSGSTTTTLAPAETTGAPDTSTPDTTGAPDTTEAPETTAVDTTVPPPDPAETALAYAERGPYPVGVTTLQLDKGPLVEVWYPAVEGTTGEDTYDVRDFVPEAIRALLTGDAQATFTTAAGRDADADDGTFPLILFSHGFTGMRLQSTTITAHLASWGFVVASPDHPSRDLTNVLGGTASGDRADSVDDLLQTRDLLLAANDEAGGRFEGRIDPDQIALIGHSAGGGTVLGAAAEPGIDGYISMASGAALREGESIPLPDVPSFFLAGTTDFVVPAEERTRPAFEAAPAPSLLWIIEGAGHNAFDDFCTFGGGTGIIGVAEASGLGAFLDAQPQLRTLGTDGCVPPSVPVAVTFPIINHAVTSWFRALFGFDEVPVGLGPEVAEAYEVPVEIQVKD